MRQTVYSLVLVFGSLACTSPTEPIVVVIPNNKTTTDSIKIYPISTSSYINARTVFVPPITTFRGSPTCGPENRRAGATNARVYVDFVGEGKILLIDNVISMPWGPTQNGILCFWELAPVGSPNQWVEVDPLRFVDDREGCWGGAKKGLVADYNLDKKPDIFFLCNVNELATDLPEGGYSLLLLSQPNGKYKKIFQPIKAYAHGGSAGDVDGDGDSDILFSNLVTLTDGTPPFVTILQNDGQGNFSRRDNLITVPTSFNCTYHEQELIDVDEDGRLDAILMSSGCPIHILWGEQGGVFGKQRSTTLISWGPYAECTHNGNSPHNVHKVGNFLYVWDYCDPTTDTWQLVKFEIGKWVPQVIWRGAMQGLNGNIYYYNGCFRHDYAGIDFCITP